MDSLKVNENINNIIKKYWLNIQAITKSYVDGNINKLMEYMDILKVIHVNLLSMWYGFDVDEKRNLNIYRFNNRKKVILKYYCRGEMEEIGLSIITCMEIFSINAREICKEFKIPYLEELEGQVKEDFYKEIKLLYEEIV